LKAKFESSYRIYSIQRCELETKQGQHGVNLHRPALTSSKMAAATMKCLQIAVETKAVKV